MGRDVRGAPGCRMYTRGRCAHERPAYQVFRCCSVDERAAPSPTCHAGGRGFESRRSRKFPCKYPCYVVGSDARILADYTHSSRSEDETAKNGPKCGRGRRFQADSGGVQAGRDGGVRTTQEDRRSRAARPAIYDSIRQKTLQQPLKTRLNASRWEPLVAAPSGLRSLWHHLASAVKGHAGKATGHCPWQYPTASSRCVRPTRFEESLR
jgi:hypothetical protein